MTGESAVVTLNGGSSSIKFALFSAETLNRAVSSEIDGVGSAHPVLRTIVTGEPVTTVDVAAVDHDAAGRLMLVEVARHLADRRLVAVGHRIVHGGRDFVRPQRLDPTTIDALRRLEAIDPEHLPLELALVGAAMCRFPGVPQVGCFDTAFHHAMPRVAKLLPIPLRFAAEGVIRYGFHGLSYAYLLSEMERVDPVAARGRLIMAHLGSGASLAAVDGGQPIDTSMGFTPASGVPMGTRCGDIDPGLPAYLARTAAMSVPQFEQMVNFQSGLLGLSETSADMRDLLAREGSDDRAADAVAVFCHQIKQRIGGLAATVGGIDTLIFTGGIGASAPIVRARICEGLGFMGVALDPSRNAAGAAIVSPDAAAVVVRVMATDEEIMIARSARDLIGATRDGVTEPRE